MGEVVSRIAVKACWPDIVAAETIVTAAIRVEIRFMPTKVVKNPQPAKRTCCGFFYVSIRAYFWGNFDESLFAKLNFTYQVSIHFYKQTARGISDLYTLQIVVDFSIVANVFDVANSCF